MNYSRSTQSDFEHGPINIVSNGFLLRSLTPDDVTPRFVEWLNAPEMMAGLNLSNIHFDEEQLRQYIKQFDHKKHYFIGIFDVKTKKLLGFYTLDINLVHKVGNITAGIGEKMHPAKTVLWATIDALLDYFYQFRNVDKISARVLAKNYAMLFCFVRNPRFVLEAKLKKECIGPAGERMDILLFSSFKE